jgi:MbtH protein
MSNPFENDDATYFVPINAEGQYSLWPSANAVPDGWEVVHGAAARAECLEYVERNWTDMRPKSLQELSQ